jgi:hypothetical protein
MDAYRTRMCAAILILALAAPGAVAQDGDRQPGQLGGEAQPDQPEQPPEQPDIAEQLTSETPPKADPTFFFYWQNDGNLFTPINGNDRHYTNGIGFEMAFRNQSYEQWEPYLLLPKDFEDPSFAVGFQVRQFIFTPEDIDNPDPIDNDRPYAGWLTLGLFAQRSDETKFDHVQLDFGVVGQNSGAEAAQEFVHSIFPNQVDPKGWDNQLDNEFAFNLKYQRRWRTPKARAEGLFEGAEYDFIGLAGFNLGNVYIDAAVGGYARIGYNLPDDFGPGRLRDFADHTGNHDGDFSAYIFGRVEGRAVARNIFLDGNTLGGSLSVDRQEFVAEASVGVEAQYKGFYASWTLTGFTEEFSGQSGGNVTGQYMFGYRAKW